MTKNKTIANVKVMHTHGGARPGAGLPKIEGGKRVLVILTIKNVETAKSLGNGNVSKGVRFALDKAKK